MPFGLLWGAAYFILVSILFARGFGAMPPGYRAAEVFLTVLLLALACGLILRQRWARWAGVGVGAYVSFQAFRWVAIRGITWDWVVFLGACLTVLMLALPVTGNVAPGPGPAARWRSRAGTAIGLLAAFALVGFMATYAPLAVRQFGSATATTSPASVVWSEFAPGLERARSEGKPVLVDFFAEWCQPCKVMDERTFRNPEVVEALQDVVPVRIDAEGTEPVQGYRGEDLANQYSVMTYPTLVLMDASGREIARSRGAKPPRGFLEWLENALEQARAGELAPASDAVM